ncbi:S24/S26 family peptidase [Actinotignum sp. GS-2025c]|uniref:S24/S26 family peptidase n=1 Tax=Actinotignum sp. GS-2025c TaxID=3427276 RepID=UPI003F46D910
MRERIARTALLLAVFVLSFFFAVAALQPNLLINTLGCRPLIVSSDSMSPRLNRGDVVGVVRADIGGAESGGYYRG